MDRRFTEVGLFSVFLGAIMAERSSAPTPLAMTTSPRSSLSWPTTDGSISRPVRGATTSMTSSSARNRLSTSKTRTNNLNYRWVAPIIVRSSMSTTRKDGRSPEQARPLSFERDFTAMAAGSVLVSFGRTVVLCTPRRRGRPALAARHRKGWVTAEYSMLPARRPSAPVARPLEASSPVAPRRFSD